MGRGVDGFRRWSDREDRCRDGFTAGVGYINADDRAGEASAKQRDSADEWELLMKIAVACPNGHRFRADEAHLGKTARCPRPNCGLNFLLLDLDPESGPSSTIALRPVENVPNVSPKRAPQSQSIPQSVQRKAGYLSEAGRIPTTVPNTVAGDLVLGTLKETLREVENAYKPSGRTTWISVLSMSLSMPIGTVFGALAGHAVVGMGLALIYLTVSLAAITGGTRCCWICGLIFIGIGITVGQPTAIGAVTGWFVALASRMGKNRSVPLAGSFGLVSGLLAWFVCGRTLSFWFELLLRSAPRELSLDEQMDGGIGRVIFLSVGFLIAAIGSTVVACAQVASAKFCERCELYMTPRHKHHCSLVWGENVVDAVAKGDWARLVNESRNSQNDLSQCTVEVTACPACGIGFLDVLASYTYTYVQKGNDDTSEQLESSATWLIASRSIGQQDVSRLCS
jgi:hypothetical protein